MKEIIFEHGIIYALFGTGGAFILRFKKKMSFRDFLGLIGIASLFGWIVGNILEFFNMGNKNIRYCLCAATGIYADEFYYELKDLATNISEWVKKRVGL